MTLQVRVTEGSVAISVPFSLGIFYFFLIQLRKAANLAVSRTLSFEAFNPL